MMFCNLYIMHKSYIWLLPRNFSGYKDGWEEECGGTSSPGGVCRGDYMSCPSMTPYKCGWTQGYKQGGRDGRARCKW